MVSSLIRSSDFDAMALEIEYPFTKDGAATLDLVNTCYNRGLVSPTSRIDPQVRSGINVIAMPIASAPAASTANQSQESRFGF